MYCNISVLFIADTTVILKLMFRTGYCFFGHLGGCVAVINIFVALVTVAVFWVIFLLFQLIFVLFLFIFVVAVVIPTAASVFGTIFAFECVCVCVCVCVSGFCCCYYNAYVSNLVLLCVPYFTVNSADK